MFQYIRSSYANDRVKFEAKIDTLENTLANEQELREEGVGDLKKTKEELESLSSNYHDNLVNFEAKVATLMEEKEKLKSENLELAAKNVSMILILASLK